MVGIVGVECDQRFSYVRNQYVASNDIDIKNSPRVHFQYLYEHCYLSSVFT